jgi:hypothetical protein
MPPEPRTVVAVAGRRVDQPDAPSPRFPPGAVPAVADSVRAFLVEHGATGLVASAACGADIVALEAAAALGLRACIVLPFDRVRFRRTSVEDRGVSWGPRYEAVLRYADATGGVVVLGDAPGTDNDAYARANERIFVEALGLARSAHATPIALAIWDANPRATTDATRDFLEGAKRNGMATFSISTLR